MQHRRTIPTVTRGPRIAPAPRVSVVIPAYRAPYLDEALESVRAQSCGMYEIVVVDDGSPEPVIPRRTDDLVLVRQVNQGPGAARNTGVRIARGEFVAFLDSDDRWLPEKIARQLAFHVTRPGCVLSFTDVVLFGEDMPPRVHSMREQYRCRDAIVPFEQLFFENCVVCSTAMVRRDAYLAARGMDPRRRFGEDYALWLRLALRGTVGYVEEVLGERRLHGGSLMAEAWQNDSWKQREAEVYEAFLAEFPALREERFVRAALARLEAQGGYHHLARAEWADARAAFARALKLHPTQLRTWAQWFRAVARVGRPAHEAAAATM